MSSEYDTPETGAESSRHSGGACLPLFFLVEGVS